MEPIRLRHAVVSERKVTRYLLSLEHPEGRGKAIFFRRVGFHPDDWAVLAQALRRHAADHPVAWEESSPFGTRYVVEGTMTTPSGRVPRVRSVWFAGPGDDAPRLVTAYSIDPR